ncbi:SKP1-like protein 20 [Apium graveolens]|uniref:SKP1-like protein 20 n=1 Tax=Apium graveolens TaxID=4045 RepID=UPI003D7B368D
MSEVERKASVPETLKSFVWIQNADGSMQEVEGKVAMLCPTLCREMQSGLGYSRSNPISLPSRVRPSILRLVFLYCKFHDVPGFSYEECEAFDKKFLAVDAITLCEIINLADYLQVEPLVRCASKALGHDMLNTSPGALHLMMNRGRDFPKANQSSDNSTCDSGNKPSSSLSKKMKEVEEKSKNPKDSRSIDDLVSFINGEESKEVQISQKKKRNRKKRQAQDNTPSICTSSSNTATILKEVAEDHVQDPCSSDAKKLGLKSTCSLSSSLHNKLKLSSTQDEASTLEEGFDDSSFDRVVEDFNRNINLSWDDRKREIYSEVERKTSSGFS